MFQYPYGSPLDPRKANQPPVGALAGKPDPLAPLPAQAAPTAPAQVLPAMPSAGLQQPLPTPPASIKRKKLSPFDKEHLAGTLARIGAGFSSNPMSFSAGLSAAAMGVAERTQELRKAEQGVTSVGGPDNAFEITENADGTRSYKAIPEVKDYLSAKERMKDAPKPHESANYIGDSLYAIEKLEPAQRAGAYQLMMEQAKSLGYDVSQAPPEYSPSFSQVMIARTIGARQGATNEATLNHRQRTYEEQAADNARADAAAARAERAAARAAETHSRSMRSSPPSTRRRSSNSDLDYLR